MGLPTTGDQPDPHRAPQMPPSPHLILPGGGPISARPAAIPAPPHTQHPTGPGPSAAPPQMPTAPTPAATTPGEPVSPFAAPATSLDGVRSPAQALAELNLPAAVHRAAEELLRVLGSDDSSEVIMNGPNEVNEKKRGQRFHVPSIAFGDAETYHRIINDVVLPFVETPDRVDGTNVLVEGQLELPSPHAGQPPMLARVHILAPPLVQFAKVTIAKKARHDFDLDAIASTGAMTPSMAEFLKAMARGRLTFVVSGPTGAGKTTLLQAMASSFDPSDRVIIIEDTPELRIPIADTVYLGSTTAKPGLNPEDMVTTEWLVKAANRMRMDRVLVGECRGAEMSEWLIAANSGAEGSATTVHAENPRRALDKILSLASKSPTAGSETTLRREIAATVDVVVQAGLIDGKHVVTHIEEVSNTVTANGMISTTTLFEYNRARALHEAKGRPSDELQSVLRQRGAAINMAWFR